MQKSIFPTSDSFCLTMSHICLVLVSTSEVKICYLPYHKIISQSSHILLVTLYSFIKKLLAQIFVQCWHSVQMLTDVEFAIYHKILDHSFLQLFVLRISSPFTIKVTDTLPRHLHSAGTTLISILVKNLLSMSDMSPCKKTSLESEHNSKGSLYYTQSSIHTIILVR